MKKLFAVLLSIFILASLPFETPAQRKKSYSNFKVKSYTNTYKTPIILNYNSFKLKTPKYNYKKSNYPIGSKTYISGERYKTTGLPKVKRSNSIKNEFLKSSGYKKEGYEVDHIIPLSKGGQDTPSNMQLLPKEAHKQKTANERKR